MFSENVKHVGNVRKLTRVINFLRLSSSLLPVVLGLLVLLRRGGREVKSRERGNIIMLLQMLRTERLAMAMVVVGIVLLGVIKEMMRKQLSGSMPKLLNSLSQRQNSERMNGVSILLPLLFKLDKKLSRKQWEKFLSVLRQEKMMMKRRIRSPMVSTILTINSEHGFK